MNPIKIFTIGFTKKTAEEFFEKLRAHGVKRVIDIRLNNTSQLAGFTRKDDLNYFLKAILDIDYIHLPELAPTKEILKEYRKNKSDWSVYESRFINLMGERKPENGLKKEIFDQACLLCSEQSPKKCHRWLVAEYLQEKWGDVDIVHII